MGSIQERAKKDGSKTYRCQVRMKGSRPLCETFTRRTDAKRWIQETEAAIREGRFFDYVESKKHTVSDLIERYKRDSFHQRKSTQTPNQTLEWWKERIGHLTLDQVNTALIREHWDILARSNSERTKKPLSNRTLNSYLETISAMFSVAVREYSWMKDNPISRIKKKPLRNARTRFLDEDELDQFLAEVEKSENPYLKVAVLITLHTGGRKSEVLGLRWQDVDLKDGRVTFRDTKNGDTRTVALRGVALDALKKHAIVRLLGSDYVFPPRRFRQKGGQGISSKPWEDLHAPFRKAVDDAGIEDFRWHDMRHCVASYLLATGATLGDVGKLLGHKTAQMTWRYAHLMQSRSDELVEKMAAKFLDEAAA